MPTTCNFANSSSFEPTAKKPKLLQPCVPLSQSHDQSPKTRPKRTIAINHKPPEIAPTLTDIALVFKSAYNLPKSYAILTTAIRTPVYLLNTEAVMSLIQLGTITKEWVIPIKQTSLKSLHTALKQPVTLDSLIFFTPLPMRFTTRVSFEAATHLTVNTLLGTFFNECFVQGKFPLE